MIEYINLDLLISSVETYGIWFTVGFLFVENVPILGFIAPGLTVLVLSGFFYELITGNFITLFLIAWLVTFCADTLWFYIGYYGQRKTRWLRALAKQSPNVEEILTSQSRIALTTYQFIPYFRMFLPFSLGLYRFSRLAWLPLCFIGSGLYTAVFFGIGVAGVTLLGGIERVDEVANSVNRVLAVFAVVYGIYLIRKYNLLTEHNKKDPR